MDREAWNLRYAEKDRVWSEEANRFVVEELAGLPPGRALDLAAGEGRNAVWLASRGWDVDAVDFSGVAFERGRALAERRGTTVRWIEADVETCELAAAAYDLVLLSYLHLPWPRMRRAIERAAAGLAPGGTFLLVGHDRSNLDRGHGGPSSPDVLYTSEQVVTALGGLLEVVQAGLRERPVETADGGAVALDCLVRARRPPE